MLVDGNEEAGGQQAVFQLSMHPAYLDVGTGLSDAFKLWSATWRRWLPWVVVVGAVAFIARAAFGALDANGVYTTDVFGRTTLTSEGAARLPQLYLQSGLLIVANAVVGWVFTATVIAGLRAWKMSPAWVVVRGLWTVVSGLAVGCLSMIVIVIAVIAGVVLVAILSQASVGLGVMAAVVLGIAGVVAAFYVAIRIAFLSLAIFDGFGPIEGIQQSWRLSHGAVLRMLGWALLAILIEIAALILGGIAAGVVAVTLPPVGAALSEMISASVGGLLVFFLAMLYESQRARMGAPGTPVAAWAGGGPMYPPGPGGVSGQPQQTPGAWPQQTPGAWPQQTPPGAWPQQTPGWPQQTPGGWPQPGGPPPASGWPQPGAGPLPGSGWPQAGGGAPQGSWPPQAQGSWPPPAPGSWQQPGFGPQPPGFGPSAPPSPPTQAPWQPAPPPEPPGPSFPSSPSDAPTVAWGTPPPAAPDSEQAANPPAPDTGAPPSDGSSQQG